MIDYFSCPARLEWSYLSLLAPLVVRGSRWQPVTLLPEQSWMRPAVFCRGWRFQRWSPAVALTAAAVIGAWHPSSPPWWWRWSAAQRKLRIGAAERSQAVLAAAVGCVSLSVNSTLARCSVASHKSAAAVSGSRAVSERRVKIAAWRRWYSGSGTRNLPRHVPAKPRSCRQVPQLYRFPQQYRRASYLRRATAISCRRSLR
jgi:hypothetical protein